MPSETFPEPLWPRVIGQERVKHILARAMAADRLPHALLFDGAEGVGKDAMAVEIARVIHCETGAITPCGRCGSCVSIEHLQHPDVHLVTALPVGKNETAEDPPLARLGPDDMKAIQEEYRRKGENPYIRIEIPRANVIKVNSIRELRRQAALTTVAGRRRVFIISRAEDMNDEAANTLLKTLEEPAGNALLILTSAQAGALLPTILSRCQRMRFDLLTEQEIASALIGRRGLDPERAALVARTAEGSYRRALELLDEDLVREREEVVAFIRHALAGNVGGLEEIIERRSSTKEREEARRFLLLMLRWFRDALVTTAGAAAGAEQAEDLRRFLHRFPGARIPDVMAAVERSLFLLDRNVYIKLVFLQLAVRLRHLILPGVARQESPGPGTT
jgi:DNA polymerase III subunit delta'